MWAGERFRSGITLHKINQNLSLSAASYPPLQKSQERGTQFVVLSGRVTLAALAWADECVRPYTISY
jgi:hypothetical protein